MTSNVSFVMSAPPASTMNTALMFEGDEKESDNNNKQELEMERFIANQVNENLRTIEEMCFVLKQSIEESSKEKLDFTLETDRAPNR